MAGSSPAGGSIRDCLAATRASASRRASGCGAPSGSPRALANARREDGFTLCRLGEAAIRSASPQPLRRVRQAGARARGFEPVSCPGCRSGSGACPRSPVRTRLPGSCSPACSVIARSPTCGPGRASEVPENRADPSRFRIASGAGCRLLRFQPVSARTPPPDFDGGPQDHGAAGERDDSPRQDREDRMAGRQDHASAFHGLPSPARRWAPAAARAETSCRVGRAAPWPLEPRVARIAILPQEARPPGSQGEPRALIACKC